MKRNKQGLVYFAWREHGSIVRGADALDMEVPKFRYNLRRYMQRHGMPTDHISVEHQREIINKFLAQDFTACRRRMTERPHQNYSFYLKDGAIHFARSDKMDGKLIGVYNSLSIVDEVRDDLYWFVTNEMETQNETAN